MDTISDEGQRVSTIGFVDDINILTYGYSTERNCKVLEETHRKCQEWAVLSGARFAPEKYELIHFTRARSHNTNATVQIEQLQLEPTEHVKILGVYVDRKLNWRTHLRMVTGKAESLLAALSRLKASTWGARVHRARRIYQVVIRPAITYGATAWFLPEEIGKGRNWMYPLLNRIQGKFLKKVIGAYKATNRITIEKELELQPLTSHLTQLVVNAHNKEKDTDIDEIVTKICERIVASARANGRKRPTPRQELDQWITKENLTNNAQEDATDGNPAENRKKRLKEYLQRHDDHRWNSYVQIQTARNHQHPAITDVKGKGRLARYKELTAAEAAIYIQIRTEKIGLNGFLHDRNVPNISAECDCGWVRQTAKHIIMFCPKWREQRQILYQSTGTIRYGEITSNKANAKALVKWFIGLNILNQFKSGQTEGQET
jgi:hypothetical protein